MTSDLTYDDLMNLVNEEKGLLDISFEKAFSNIIESLGDSLITVENPPSYLDFFSVIVLRDCTLLFLCNGDLLDLHIIKGDNSHQHVDITPC